MPCHAGVAIGERILLSHQGSRRQLVAAHSDGWSYGFGRPLCDYSFPQSVREPSPIPQLATAAQIPVGAGAAELPGPVHLRAVALR